MKDLFKTLLEFSAYIATLLLTVFTVGVLIAFLFLKVIEPLLFS